MDLVLWCLELWGGSYSISKFLLILKNKKLLFIFINVFWTNDVNDN